MLQTSYVSDLEYRGWTVHGDGQGNLAAYSYDRRELLNATLGESSANLNQTALQVEMHTAADPPPEFVLASPTPTTAPR